MTMVDLQPGDASHILAALQSQMIILHQAPDVVANEMLGLMGPFFKAMNAPPPVASKADYVDQLESLYRKIAKALEVKTSS